MTDEKLDKSLHSDALAPSAFRFEKMADDITDIKLSLAKIEGTLERNTNDVEKHIRRSDLLESKVQ